MEFLDKIKYKRTVCTTHTIKEYVMKKETGESLIVHHVLFEAFTEKSGRFWQWLLAKNTLGKDSWSPLYMLGGNFIGHKIMMQWEDITRMHDLFNTSTSAHNRQQLIKSMQRTGHKTQFGQYEVQLEHSGTVIVQGTRHPDDSSIVCLSLHET